MTEPMRGPSTPSDQVRGPQDLVAYMNTATSEDWDMVPLPAKQQLGYHERLHPNQSINDYTGKGPEELLHSVEQSEVTDSTAKLSSFVDYHLESTAPPAEPAGAPGSDGYNRLNRQVPPAKGFESEADATLTQTTGGRVVQFASDQGLSPEEQAKVDGVGPHVPSPVQIVPGQGEANQPEAEHARYGTANGVTHGHAESFDPDAKAKTDKHYADLAEVAADQAKSNAVAGPAPAAPAAPSASAKDESAAGTQSDAPAASEDADGDGDVPGGSIDKVLAWVGDDKARARKAHDAEQGKQEPRQTLIAKLNEKL